ncbi:MAG TPA: hypothetical protein PK358_13690 [Spirochaetota bacterium]|nr:hypothetical protein [Spirochaetota bacterium]HPJ35885.1 hypothetical protein [Spirochaetota bacterium]
MRKKGKKDNTVKDDSLFGLLSSYKQFNTYVRVLIDEERAMIAVVLTANPKFWQKLPPETYSAYRDMKRLELGVDKLSVKYILPQHLVKTLGPAAGFSLRADKYELDNSLSENGYYVIIVQKKYIAKVLSGVKKIINLSPQKKYEIIEKSMFDQQEI